GVHPVHFSRTFKRFFHCSASEYRQRKQLDRAILQLSQQHSLSDTALQAGFADQSHMQRSFRRYLGATPRQLQMLLRLKQL
ncbi:helix-turn-helix domain-containing protein, partial [Comamonas terrae]